MPLIKFYRSNIFSGNKFIELPTSAISSLSLDVKISYHFASLKVYKNGPLTLELTKT
jgi:hypothetical protein